MTKTKLSPEEQVTAFITTSAHPLANVMQALREIILGTSPEISEHIKWNSPAFYYNGEMAPFDPKEYKRDIVVYNVRKPGEILLIFPTGAKVIDITGILDGKFADGRRMVTITSMGDFTAKKEALQNVIRHWLALIEKLKSYRRTISGKIDAGEQLVYDKLPAKARKALPVRNKSPKNPVLCLTNW
ncbi:DUF1801 domain-containing protein [Flavobacterium album]|nr:DUF1801 domain-containing protein [Flavobacterium album]